MASHRSSSRKRPATLEEEVAAAAAAADSAPTTTRRITRGSTPIIINEETTATSNTGGASDPIDVDATPSRGRNKRRRVETDTEKVADDQPKEEEQEEEPEHKSNTRTAQPSHHEKDEEMVDDESKEEHKSSLNSLPPPSPRVRRLGSTRQPQGGVLVPHVQRGAALAAAKKLSHANNQIIDVSEDDSNETSTRPIRAKISMQGQPLATTIVSLAPSGGRSTRYHAPVNYKEVPESGIVRGNSNSHHPPQRSTRASRSSAAAEDASDQTAAAASSSRRATPTSPHRHDSGLASFQKITRQQAKEMGVPFEELSRMAGVEPDEDPSPEDITLSSRRLTRHSAAAAASSTAAPASVSTDEDTSRRRNRRSKRIANDDEDGDEYQQPQAEEESSSSDSEESEGYGRPRRLRPRREATRVTTYSEDKLARQQLNQRRPDEDDDDDDDLDHDTRRPRGERTQVVTSYFREIKKDIIRLADGREVTDREYRAMLRQGEQVRVLRPGEEPGADAGVLNPQHPDESEFVRRSQRQRQPVQHYTVGNKESGDDSDHHKQTRFNSRVGGRRSNKGRRSGPTRHSRPMRYGDSSSSPSSTSDSSDEDLARAKDRRRLNRERASIQPLHLQIQHAMRKMDAEANAAGIHSRDGKSKDGKLADIDPIEVDTHVDWSAIGGLDAHIHALKEMVVLPLLYPELFEKFQVQPPKGVLFFGPPGCGKTLVARALANTCSATGQKVSFFMRKGSDCLSKWVGEAERQLRLLFEQAHKMQPAIIFFDELDGLAPVRSSRQDQIHASIVSTLLALMDGLDNRGQVIVIGATNRVDSIDPALRRPGRFDRELMFSLPSKPARRAILDINTRNWTPRPQKHFLDSIADMCVGYCGADLRSLCTEATLRAVRRKYPQIYMSTDKLAIDISAIKLKQCDFIDAMRQIVPASHRATNVHTRSIPTHLDPLLQPILAEMIRLVSTIFPLGAMTKSAQANASHIIVDSDDEMVDVDEEKKEVKPEMTPVEATLDLPPSSFPLPSSAAVPTSTLASSPPVPSAVLSSLPPRPTLPLPFKPRFLLHAKSSHMGQSHLGPALLHHFEEFPTFSLDLPLLLGDANAKNAEESCVRIIQECKRNAPAVLFWPHIDLWWSMASESLQNTILMLLTDLPPSSSIFLFATADCLQNQLPAELHAIFPISSNPSTSTLALEIPQPTSSQVAQFLQPILNELTREIPRMKQITQLDQLPVLPRLKDVLPSASGIKLTPQQEVDREATLTPEQLKLKLDHEESLIRLQRMSFRNILVKLLKAFPEFAHPVNTDEHPDYLAVVAQAVCLEQILDAVNALDNKPDTTKTDTAKPEKVTYDTVTKFLNMIDLLVNNCKEYSHHCGNQYRSLVNRACHLQDITLSMTSQLETKLTQECEEISKRRIERLRRAAQQQPANAASSNIHASPQRRSTRAKTSAAPETQVDMQPATAATTATSTIVKTDSLAAPSDGVISMEVDSDEKDSTAIKMEDVTPTAEESTSIGLVAPSPEPTVSPTTAPSPTNTIEPSTSATAAASASPTSPTVANIVLLPPPPPIVLPAGGIDALLTALVPLLVGQDLDTIEMLGFQMMKIVIDYQMKPNRVEAIEKIEALARDANLS